MRYVAFSFFHGPTTCFLLCSFLALLSLFHHGCLFSALGRESRLPLTVKGKGMGPELEFNYNGIELEDFFIGEKYRQEIRKMSHNEHL